MRSALVEGAHIQKRGRIRQRDLTPTNAPVGVVDLTATTKSSPGDNARTSTAGDWRETPEADELELDFRHRGWAEKRALVTQAMQQAGYPAARLDRFRNCGAAARVLEHVATGEFKTRAFYCHDRFCEKCGQARTLRIGDNLIGQLRSTDAIGVHVVLTTRHKDTPLADQVSKIKKDFKKLRNDALWRHAIKGGAWFLQLHVARSDGLWHVHLHIIGECVRYAGQPAWLDALRLSMKWHEITGDSDNVHVRRIHDAESVAREVCRYAAKPADGNSTSDPDKLAELMIALNGSRLCNTFGSWHSFALAKQLPAEDPEQWLDHGPLVDLIWRARRGERWANVVLDRLWSRTLPKTGPPALFDAAWTNK
jgi:hypothetical protein